MQYVKNAQIQQEARFLKASQVARLLGVTPATVRAAVRRGELHGIRVGSQILVRKDALEALISTRFGTVENETGDLGAS